MNRETLRAMDWPARVAYANEKGLYASGLADALGYTRAAVTLGCRRNGLTLSAKGKPGPAAGSDAAIWNGKALRRGRALASPRLRWLARLSKADRQAYAAIRSNQGAAEAERIVRADIAARKRRAKAVRT